MSVIEKVNNLDSMLDSVKETINDINKRYEKILNYMNDKIKNDLDDVNKIKESFKEIDKYITQDNKVDDEQYKCFSFVDICCAMKRKNHLLFEYLGYNITADEILSECFYCLGRMFGRDHYYSPFVIDLNYLLNKNKSFTVETFKDKKYDVRIYNDNVFYLEGSYFERFFKDFCKDEITEEQLKNISSAFESIILDSGYYNINEINSNKQKILFENNFITK